MKTLLQKLSSRKFLLVLFTIFAVLWDLIPQEETFEIVSLVIGYIVGEGIVDANRQA